MEWYRRLFRFETGRVLYKCRMEIELLLQMYKKIIVDEEVV